MSHPSYRKLPKANLTVSTSPYPIYVINVKRNPERKLHIQRQLDALNLSYEFVDAIDKHDLHSPQYRGEIARLSGIDRSVIERAYTTYYYDHLACALSHVKAYNLMIERNNSVACILEDDAVLSADFPEVLHATQKQSWDILMLSSHSRTTRYLLGTNPNLRKGIEALPEIDCALFPRLRKIKWYRKMVPNNLTPSKSQLDWRHIPKLEWCLLMLLSRSKVFNDLFKYSINAYKYLLRFYKPNHPVLYTDKQECKRAYVCCKIGGLPIRSSQQTLCEAYDIAMPAERPTSGMAYLLTSAAANKCKAVVNSKVRLPIDYIPWYLHEKHDVRLRIVTPPCAIASLQYLKSSARDGQVSD